MAELDPGTIVDSRYEILSHLGSGGMGAVYRVRDLQGDGDAALKVLNTAVDQDEVRQRFLREFSILSRIRHPRIVRPHQWGMYEGRPYFAMDYISGNSLDVWVKEGEKRAQLVDSHFFSLIHQIGEGLTHIHERGWVHRDLKPSNIESTPKSHLLIKQEVLNLKCEKAAGMQMYKKQKTGDRTDV